MAARPHTSPHPPHPPYVTERHWRPLHPTHLPPRTSSVAGANETHPCGGTITDGSHVSGPYQGIEASSCPAKVIVPCEVCSDLVRLAEHKGIDTKYTKQVPLKHSIETCLLGRDFSKASRLASFNCIKQGEAPQERAKCRSSGGR